MTRTALLLALAIAVAARAQPAPADARAPVARRLVEAAVAQTSHRVLYDGSYRRIPYPGGDVPPSVGVCTDVIIRAYRAAGIDLQERVHEDMALAFGAYPKRWGLSGPDPNIDHRRVPNLETYFLRGMTHPPTASDAPAMMKRGADGRARLASGSLHASMNQSSCATALRRGSSHGQARH